MSKKHKKVCTALNYCKHFVIFISAVSGCVSIFAFASLACIHISITSSALELKICAITAGIKKYRPIIKKKKKKIDKLLLLGKNKINTIKVLISKALIGSYSSW